MKKNKIILTLATILIASQPIVNGLAFAETKTQETTTISQNVQKDYNNKINFRGIEVQGHIYHGGQIQFDVSDPTNKKINVTDVRGSQYPTHPYFGNDTYMSVTLSDAYGNVKKSVDVKGNDRIDKMCELTGTTFEYGDYLKITHREAPSRLKIDGKVINDFSYDHIPTWVLNQYHYRITEKGLQLVWDSVLNAEVKQSYWDDTLDNSTFTLNAKFAFDNQKISNEYSEKLLIKDSNGNEVGKIDGKSLNWFSEDADIYNSAQFILKKDILENLKEGTYSFTLQVLKNGKVQTNIDLLQNENTKPVNPIIRPNAISEHDKISLRYNVYKNINDTEEKIIGNKSYKFKTTDSKTGNVLLEVKNLNK